MTSKWGIDLANKSNPKLGGTKKKKLRMKK
jgi:hypothetical protein